MTYELRRLIQGEDKNSDLYWEQDFYHPNGNIVYDCQGYSIKGSGNVLFFISPEVEVRSRSTSELEQLVPSSKSASIPNSVQKLET